MAVLLSKFSMGPVDHKLSNRGSFRVREEVEIDELLE